MNILLAFFSKNVLAFAVLAAFVGWATIAVKKHDTKVARAAVAEHTEKAREVVKKAKTAQRRIDPSSAGGVLARKYCADCPGE